MATFHIDKFLRKFKPIYIKQYFDSLNQRLPFEVSEDTIQDAAYRERMTKVFDVFPVKVRNQIEEEGTAVLEMACPDGMLQILSEAEFHGISVKDLFVDEITMDERALLFLVRGRDAFHAAYEWFQIYGDTRKWQSVSGVAKCSLATLKKREGDLKAGVQEMLASQDRGSYCEVKPHYRKEIIHYAVDFSNYTKQEDGVQDGTRRSIIYNPIGDIDFLYAPDLQELSVKARKGVDKTILLQVFEEAVLKDSDGERKVGLYEISRVLEPGYAFIHSSTEQIQRIILSEAKFVRQHGAWHTISIGRDGTNKQMEADLFLLRDFLVNAKLYQVTLYFVFPGKTKRGKAEKVILTDGKECQLGNTYKHQLIKKHLTDYKIRYVASI